MKKSIFLCAAVAAIVSGMWSCAPVESNFSTNANYTFFLYAQYGEGDSQIGVPTLKAAERKIDSVLNDYLTTSKLGGTFLFSAGGTYPAEMQAMLYRKIKVMFDSLSKEVAKVDFSEVLDSTKNFWGGDLRLIYQVSPAEMLTPIMRDTIVERMRINFIPAVESRWNVVGDSGPIAYYIFRAYNRVDIYGVAAAHVEYTIDPVTGIFAIPASEAGAEHQLVFHSDGQKPSFISSPSGKRYLLQQ